MYPAGELIDMLAVIRSVLGMTELSVAHKKVMEKILTTAATLERGYLGLSDRGLSHSV
jgi:hypothetical protein